MRTSSRPTLWPMVLVLCVSQATCASDPPIGVQDPVTALLVSPAVAASAPGAVSIQFSATDTQHRAQTVTWRVNGTPGGNAEIGTISAAGLYSPPAKLPTGDSVVVTAVLASDAAVQQSSPVLFVPDLSSSDYYVALPRVVDQSSTQQMRVLVVPPATVASVIFLPKGGGSPVTLQPIGNNVHLLTLSAGTATSGYLSNHLHNHAGQLDYRTAADARVKLTNLGINVRDAGQANVSVTPLAADAQRSPHLLNIRLDAVTTTPPPAIVARTRQLLGDNFDFIGVVATVTTNNNRFYQGVRNEVQGIGLPIYDNSAAFGGTGRLRGVINFPIDAFMDGAESGMIHEIGHAFINFGKDTVLSSGVPHWPMSTMAHHVMGFSIPGSGAGGQFNWDLTLQSQGSMLVTSSPSTDLYHPLDLYLMGLLPADSVPQMLVLAKTVASTAITNGAVLPGMTYQISDYVAAHGARSPSSATAQKDFALAIVVLTYGRLLTASEMAFFDNAAARAETRVAVPAASGLAIRNASGFFLATGGRATLKSKLP